MELDTINGGSNMYNPILTFVNGNVHVPDELTNTLEQSSEQGEYPTSSFVNMVVFHAKLDPRFSSEIYSMVPYEVPGMRCERKEDVISIYLSGYSFFPYGYIGKVLKA